MRALAALLAVLAGGCAGPEQTRRMDRTRPIEIEQSSWRGTGVAQDGVRLDAADLVAALAATPAASEPLRSAERNALASTGLLLGAVGLTVAAVLVDDSHTATGLAIGAVGACGGSFYFRARANSGFVDAVRAYNASLPQATPTPAAPPASSAPAGRAMRPTIGVSLSF